MKFTQYYLDCLSQASYLIGDETTGRAVVVDPRRDIDEYVQSATFGSGSSESGGFNFLTTLATPLSDGMPFVQPVGRAASLTIHGEPLGTSRRLADGGLAAGAGGRLARARRGGGRARLC